MVVVVVIGIAVAIVITVVIILRLQVNMNPEKGTVKNNVEKDGYFGVHVGLGLRVD